MPGWSWENKRAQTVRETPIGPRPKNDLVGVVCLAGEEHSVGYASISPRLPISQIRRRVRPRVARRGSTRYTHRQLAKATHEGGAHPRRLADHLDTLETLQNLFPEYLQLQLGQAIAHATMNPKAK
jgi:hypothetical protein